MVPIDLKEDLIRELGTLIGTYTTSTGKTYPAIRIVPPLVDPTWKIQGLEVLISVHPDSVKIEPLSNEKLKRQWWSVILTQFDTSKSTKPALDIIERYYPRVISRVTPQSIADFERCAVSIFDPVFLGKSGYLK